MEHNKGTESRHFKKLLWQYSVDNVREELRAQALLECKDEITDDDIDEEPSLVSEELSTSIVKDGDGEVSKGSNKFVLHLDGMKNAKEQQQLAAARQEAQEQSSNLDNAPLDSNASEGLRRRHQSTATAATQDDVIDTKANEWTTELDALTSSNNNTNEERLQQQQYTDPLNLFGIPPPALRVAQAKSRSAISYYVEVANLAREIIRITNENGVE